MSQPKFKLLVCSVFTLMFFIPFLIAQSAYCQNDSGYDFQGVEKIINPEFLNKLKSPKNKTGIIVLLKGYKSYVGAVRAEDTAQMAAMQDEIRQRQDAVIERMSAKDFTLKYKYGNLLGFAGTATLEGVRALAAMDEVEVIEEDKEMEAHLAQGIPLMHASNPRSLYDGTGISVAIVDTGIDYSHSMLGGGTFPNSKVIGGYDFGDNDSDPVDCEGHGTAVAGIVAGTEATGPGDYIGGVAYNAKLYGLKIVSGCSGSSSSATIAAAWDWAVTHKNDDPDNPILIINTSFGGGYYQSACDSSEPAVAAAAANAVNNGITLFVSSGNDGYCDAIGAPACVSNAISVGAVYDANIGNGFGFCISRRSCIGSFNGGCTPSRWVCFENSSSADQVTCYSNSADFLDLLASSNNAYTTGLSGAYNEDFGGTSAASPYAAGAATVLQSAAKSITGSFLSPADVKSKLISTGDSILDSKSNISKPRINLEAAVNTLSGGGGNPIINVTPDSLDSAQSANTSVNKTLSIGNTGTGALNWTIDEANSASTAKPVDLTKTVKRLAKTAAVRSGLAKSSHNQPYSVKATNLINDGGFEAGIPNPSWIEYSLNFGTPLCDAGSCGIGNGAHSGTFWAWFGGIDVYEEGAVYQNVTIPSGSATLSFYLEVPVCDSVSDYMEVLIDDTQVFKVDGGNAACGVNGYVLKTVDVSAFADGNSHTVNFHSETFAGNGRWSNFFVDDVVLESGGSASSCDSPSDIPWLSLSSTSGSTQAGNSSNVTVTFNSTGLAAGTYDATLCVNSNDPATPRVEVPVMMTVTSGGTTQWKRLETSKSVKYKIKN